SHFVTRLGLAFLVVGVKLLVLRDHFLVFGMGKTALHLHHDGLGHLIGEHFANAFLALSANDPFFAGFSLNHIKIKRPSSAAPSSRFRCARHRGATSAVGMVSPTGCWPVAGA